MTVPGGFRFEALWQSETNPMVTLRGGRAGKVTGVVSHHRRDIADPYKDPADTIAQLGERSFGRAAIVRFDPDQLRRSSHLVPQGAESKFLIHRGEGLPGMYNGILGRKREAFGAIVERLRRLFPGINELRVEATTESKLSLYVDLTDGTVISQSQMSEGLLYYLAFEALAQLSDASFLAIEEPENGLHPARIADVVRVLRALCEQGMQVVLATHSPLVINELRPDEVSIVRRPSIAAGTEVVPIKSTPHFVQRSEIYSLGELWLAHADGLTESLDGFQGLTS